MVDDRLGSIFFLCGYPTIANSVDYIRGQVETQQYFLHGRYARPDKHSDSTHEICLANDLGLTDFDGLSGSPVFCLAPFSTNPMPRLCGMAIRGSAESGIVHFLDEKAILRVLQATNQDDPTRSVDLDEFLGPKHRLPYIVKSRWRS